MRACFSSQCPGRHRQAGAIPAHRQAVRHVSHYCHRMPVGIKVEINCARHVGYDRRFQVRRKQFSPRFGLDGDFSRRHVAVRSTARVTRRMSSLTRTAPCSKLSTIAFDRLMREAPRSLAAPFLQASPSRRFPLASAPTNKRLGPSVTQQFTAMPINQTRGAILCLVVETQTGFACILNL